jgi:hypothetical protein
MIYIVRRVDDATEARGGPDVPEALVTKGWRTKKRSTCGSNAYIATTPTSIRAKIDDFVGRYVTGWSRDMLSDNGITEPVSDNGPGVPAFIVVSCLCSCLCLFLEIMCKVYAMHLTKSRMILARVWVYGHRNNAIIKYDEYDELNYNNIKGHGQLKQCRKPSC